MITSLDRTHAGFYRCIVRNRMGALLQRQTEVQVACEYSGDLGNNGANTVAFHPCSKSLELFLHGQASPFILCMVEPRPREGMGNQKATQLIGDLHHFSVLRLESPALPGTSFLKSMALTLPPSSSFGRSNGCLDLTVLGITHLEQPEHRLPVISRRHNWESSNPVRGQGVE